MLDRDNRLRVFGVATLAVAVMGGVIVSAMVVRNRHSSADSEPPKAPDPSVYGKTRTDKVHEMPAGCEVDPKSPPSIVFDLPDGGALDLGFVKQGPQVEREVTVRNTGSGVLCVSGVDTGCGCVKAELLGEAQIPPMGTRKIRCRADTSNREGLQSKVVTVTSNDPAKKTSTFKVVFDVRLGVILARGAGSTFFGRHSPGKSGEIVVRLLCPKDEPEWEVTGVEGTKTKFTWTVKRVEAEDPNHRVYDVTIVHPGAYEATLYNEALKIRTSHPERPEIVVDTQMIVVTKYFSGPPSLSFGFVGGDSVPQPRTALLMAGEEGAGFQVKSARIDGKGFSAKEPVRVKDGWTVDVTYDGQSRKGGPLEATLVVSIDDPEMPELRVPVHATVRGAK